MLALKEFANFIARNMANLATTYARLLAEGGGGYEHIPANRRKASGRKLLNAVVEACESETPDPLCHLFEAHAEPNRRWANHIEPPQPLLEVECLGQTLTPVVTNLDAGKFLWQILAEVRTRILYKIEDGKSYFSPSTLNSDRRKVEMLLPAAEPRLGEEGAQERWDFLQVLIDTIPSPIFYKDVKGVYLGCNKAFEDYIGLPKEELVGKSVYNVFPEELADKHYAMDTELFEQPGPQVYEALVRYVDGTDRHIIFNKAVFLGPDGTPAGLVGVMVDITERTQAESLLAKRAAELETVAEVSTVASTILEVDKLLQKVVDLTKERFKLYHAHIYLLNETGDTLELAAGAGQVGQQLVAERWQIPLDREQSLVARAARTQQGVTINDVQADPHFLPNPLLPDTRSEMAVPVIVGDQLLGVLDVQSDVIGRFTAEDVRIQTTLATQVAVALQNARLFAGQQQTQFLLQERVKTLKCLNDTGRRTEESPSIPELLHWVTERIPSAMQYPNLCKVAIGFGDQTYGSSEAVNLPAQMTHGLYIKGEVMGRVYIAYTEKQDFLDEESAMLGAIATRLSGYIENQRLLEETEAALAEMKQSQELLRTIIDATPDWIFIKDRDHRYRLANQGYAQALHISPDEFIDKNDLELGFPEELVKGNPEKGIRGFWADDRLVMDSGETQVYASDPATIDGEVHIFHTIKTPLRDVKGDVWGVLAFARDVTEREQLLAEVERQARRERTIREITAKMRAAPNLERLVKTVAEELGRRFSTEYALVELGLEENGHPISVSDQLP